MKTAILTVGTEILFGQIVNTNAAFLSQELQNMGFDVKSVNALNKIMEKMGLLIHYGNGWGTTDAGAKFSMWHKGVLNSDAWHPELVDEIAKYLKEK